jgi:GH25 family lysozyme M1 (1,4-beta-N-acetylmuramidase)
LPDWNLAKDSGLDYVIVRSSMGVAGVDESYSYNVIGARQAGIGVGAYHFFRPEHRGQSQAAHFLSVLESHAIDDFIAVDVEPPSDGTTIHPTLYADELYNFITEIKLRRGSYPDIYTNFESWRLLVGTQHDAEFSKCGLWVANYGVTTPLLPRCWKSYKLWQYSSSGTVPGISKTWNGSEFVWGRVDLNRINDAPEVKPLRRFIVPVDFPYVVSGNFNDPRNYDFAPERKQLHEGVDFAPKRGTSEPYAVIAPDAGKIVKVGYDPRGYGNYLVIEHSDGFTSWLAHLKEPTFLKVGTLVELGSLVGYAGSTGGMSTGTHLHWTLQRQSFGLSNYVVADVVPPLEYIMV